MEKDGQKKPWQFRCKCAQERAEQLLRQYEKKVAELKELQKMTLEAMWETLGATKTRKISRR